MDKAIELLEAGHDHDKIARALPEAKDIGFSSEMEAFGLNFCTAWAWVSTSGRK